MLTTKWCEDFFETKFEKASTSKNTAKNHKYAMQKCLDVIEQKNEPLKDNLKIKLALKTQPDRIKISTIEKRRTIGTYSSNPLKCISINDKSKLLEVVWNYSNYVMLIVDSLLFLCRTHTWLLFEFWLFSRAFFWRHLIAWRRSTTSFKNGW